MLVIISLQRSLYCDSELFYEIHIFIVYWLLLGRVLFTMIYIQHLKTTGTNLCIIVGGLKGMWYVVNEVFC